MTKTSFMTVASFAVSAFITVFAADDLNKFELLTGGFVDKPLPDNSKIVLLVNSSSSTNDVFKKFSQRLSLVHHVPHKVVMADFAKLDNPNGNIVIAVVDAGDFVVYPNKHLAVVPITEACKEKVLEKALVYALGEGSDQANARNIAAGAKAIGIPYLVRTSYKNALEKGWAPPPTTPAQKALFEKFQSEKAGVDAANAAATNAPTAMF